MFNFKTTQIDNNDYEFLAGSIRGKLSDILEDLPTNCYVNKTVCGCGATTLALLNKKDYLILSPFTALLDSKRNQYPGLLYVTGETSIGEITEYIEFNTKCSLPIKIMATYDSLKRIITEVTNFDTTKIKLMIDEAHLLVNLASFKSGVCQYILKHYKDFTDYVFVTATPTRREFLPNEIETLPILTIKWEDVVAANFKAYYLTSEVSMVKKLTALSLSTLLDETQREVHIFYNSVQELLIVLQKLKKSKEINFKREDFRLVCSKSQSTKVQEGLGKIFGTIDTLASPVRKLNFYTSTAFEGGDVISKLPETCEQYICINGKRDHTKLDFTSTVSQIVGRIRNKVDNNIHFLISNAPDSIKYTEVEWKNEVKDRVSSITRLLNDVYNNTTISEELRESGLKTSLDNPYTYYDDELERVIVSDVAVKCELQAYQALHATYFIQVEEETKPKSYKLNHILQDTNNYNDYSIRFESFMLHLLGYQSFQKTMETYCELKGTTSNQHLITLMDKCSPEINEYYTRLGETKIKALSYSETKIIRELNKIEDETRLTKVRPTLVCSEFYTKKELKDIIQNFYNTHGIVLKAKATDINNWYKVRRTHKNGIQGLRIESII